MSTGNLKGIDLRSGVTTNATLRHYACQNCGHVNEVRWRGFVPASYYNVMRDYVRDAAGDEFVLLPVQTLNAMGAELERLRRSDLTSRGQSE